jgi:hypothetical protein
MHVVSRVHGEPPSDFECPSSFAGTLSGVALDDRGCGETSTSSDPCAALPITIQTYGRLGASKQEWAAPPVRRCALRAVRKGDIMSSRYHGCVSSMGSWSHEERMRPLMTRKKKETPVAAGLASQHMVAAPRQRLPYVMATVSPEQLRRIKQLALDENATVTDLLLRGLDMVFKSKKLPPL